MATRFPNEDEDSEYEEVDDSTLNAVGRMVIILPDPSMASPGKDVGIGQLISAGSETFMELEGDFMCYYRINRGFEITHEGVVYRVINESDVLVVVGDLSDCDCGENDDGEDDEDTDD